VRVLLEHTDPKLVDACLINDAVVSNEEALNRYRNENAYPVAADGDRIKAMGIKVIATDLLSVADYVRHDSKKLTQALIKLIETQRVIKRYELFRMSKIEKELIVVNKKGMHARPAALFVGLVEKFDVTVTLAKGSEVGQWQIYYGDFDVGSGRGDCFEDYR
jgi:hypothetical protein